VTVIERVHRSRFIRFALVGSAGFVVNEIALAGALGLLHVDKHIAWFVAFPVAVTFTWWGNRTFTFHDVSARKGLFREWLTFLVANSLGAGANLATYSVLITFVAPPMGDPLVANAAGTLVGLLFNFVTSQRFVFRDRSP
jgi:putative flippase GtrA